MLAMAEAPRLKRLGDRLRELREKREETTGRKVYQRDAAKLLSVKEDTYRAYEYGRAELPEKLAKVLAGEWGLEWQEFYRVGKRGKTSGLKTPQGSDEVGRPRSTVSEGEIPIPFVGGIAASSKVDWTDPLASEAEEYVPSEMARKGVFCCRVVGDSMYSFLWPDDIAVFQSTKDPKVGRIVIHQDSELRVTVKQLKHNGTGWMLNPLNPSYDAEPASGTILGHLIGVIRDLDGTRLTLFNENGLSPKVLENLT